MALRAEKHQSMKTHRARVATGWKRVQYVTTGSFGAFSRIQGEFVVVQSGYRMDFAEKLPSSVLENVIHLDIVGICTALLSSIGSPAIKTYHQLSKENNQLAGRNCFFSTCTPII